ncbi:cupin [Mycobacterium sp. 852002-53434_SCH5985345]|uniref:cupin domain-containing protein n=1 Tax=unclassified Mycobacterium TaxID=2642494 RepID=UPI0007FDAB55|nr:MULTISPECIES: cupin domain-containing protein [unclassified Mycobacterium]OBF49587.1 cupin [Mycobacterium sp. 852002-53434_SCH5985345]OBF73087.1 cupin [Mycobacterium sp. 852002-51613_SCH5001154]OBG00124.1 cupin [Mycobacterium sp. 852014-52450_SCH5900713]
MATADGFHPDFDETTLEAAHNRVHHVRASDITSDTAQSEGLRRFAALSGASVGAEKLWMGETHAMPSTVSSNHHHGDSETAIYVRSGHPEFVFHDGAQEVRISTSPGDYVFIPPHLPHREENPDPDAPAEVVIARSTQEAIVVNLPTLYPLQ